MSEISTHITALRGIQLPFANLRQKPYYTLRTNWLKQLIEFTVIYLWKTKNIYIYIRLIVHYTDRFSFNRLYNYIVGRPIESLFQLLREYSALNTGLTVGA